MVHFARCIALLFALPSEREKPSWIDWTIEIPPSTHWVLLGRVGSPRTARIFEWAITQPSVRRCARRSLTSYPPVVHTCSHFGARVRRRHKLPHETTRAPPQVPQCFDGALAGCSYYLHIVWRWLENAGTRAESLEKSRFSRFLLACPQWHPTLVSKHNFPQHNLLIAMIDKHLWNILSKEIAVSRLDLDSAPYLFFLCYLF